MEEGDGGGVACRSMVVKVCKMSIVMKCVSVVEKVSENVPAKPDKLSSKINTARY